MKGYTLATLPLLFYFAALIFRFVFLWLSSRILKTKRNSFLNALIIVAINGVAGFVFGLLGKIAGLHGTIFSIVVFLLTALVAFIAARKIYKISFADSLALYTLASSMLAVFFLIFTLFVRL